MTIASATATPPPPALAAPLKTSQFGNVKNPAALLRYALPVENKDIRNVQAALERISDDERIPANKARRLKLKQDISAASDALNGGRKAILAANAGAATQLDALAKGLDEFVAIVENAGSDKGLEGEANLQQIPIKQEALLNIVGAVEQGMVKGMAFDVPKQYAESMPTLLGRATVEVELQIANPPNAASGDDGRRKMTLELDGYNAPVTAGRFLSLVESGQYNNVKINRADGFLVQASGGGATSDPIPLEIRVANANRGAPPEYGMTFEDLGMYQDSPQLNFNALGTLGMAHSESDANDATSQFFWAIPDPRQGNLLDGRFAVFGYTTSGMEAVRELSQGDVIKSMRVVAGKDNLIRPKGYEAPASAPAVAAATEEADGGSSSSE